MRNCCANGLGMRWWRSGCINGSGLVLAGNNSVQITGSSLEFPHRQCSLLGYGRKYGDQCDYADESDHRWCRFRICPSRWPVISDSSFHRYGRHRIQLCFSRCGSAPCALCCKEVCSLKCTFLTGLHRRIHRS